MDDNRSQSTSTPKDRNHTPKSRVPLGGGYAGHIIGEPERELGISFQTRVDVLRPENAVLEDAVHNLETHLDVFEQRTTVMFGMQHQLGEITKSTITLST